MSSETCSTINFDGRVATVTIATEGGLNVMSSAAIRRLGDAIEQVKRNTDVRFTVIRAEGKVFVAGADIKEMSDYQPQEGRTFGELGSSVCDAIEALPSITLAALQGAALGGGCEIALACDFRIATTRVKVGLPETTLGLIPGWGGIPRAVRLLGESAAKRLIFSGAVISAEEAKSIGLFDEVVPDADALQDAIIKLWGYFDRGSPAAVALVKRALRNGKDVSAFADCFAGPESREGMTAFIEKREPAWTKG